MQKSTTLIKLINFDDNVKEALEKENLNVSSNKLNGILVDEDKERTIRTFLKTPSDLHEMDYIIISGKPLVNNGHDNKKGYFRFTPKEGSSSVDLTAFDMAFLRKKIFTTNNKQVIVIFANNFSLQNYSYYTPNTVDGNPDYLTCDTLGFTEFPRTKNEFRQGTICIEPSEVIKEFSGITALLMKYESGLNFGTVYKLEDRSSQALLLSKAGDVIAKFQIEKGKYFLYLPQIKRIGSFLVDLFTTVLPESDFNFFKRTMSEYGSFKWTTDFEYISHNEKLKRISIANEIEKHKVLLKTLEQELKVIEENEENVWVKSLLTATGDSLVEAVINFLKFIGFENVTQPDDDSEKHPDKLLEEDINISLNDNFTYIIECKGIGGTSTDANCQQASKIALRRKDAASKRGEPGHVFQAIYIVNHQRYKAPELRENPPFKGPQIEDARIASRGMVSTYEIFKAYHMVKSEVLSKHDARDCFNQHGVIDFRTKLKPLFCDAKFSKSKVYSFDLKKTPETIIKISDKIVIEDNENHWHILDIKGLQVNRIDINTATCNDTHSVGVKVENFIENIKNLYVIS